MDPHVEGGDELIGLSGVAGELERRRRRRDVRLPVPPPRRRDRKPLRDRLGQRHVAPHTIRRIDVGPVGHDVRRRRGRSGRSPERRRPRTFQPVRPPPHGVGRSLFGDFGDQAVGPYLGAVPLSADVDERRQATVRIFAAAASGGDATAGAARSRRTSWVDRRAGGSCRPPLRSWPTRGAARGERSADRLHAAALRRLRRGVAGSTGADERCRSRRLKRLPSRRSPRRSARRIAVADVLGRTGPGRSSPRRAPSRWPSSTSSATIS